MNFKDLQFSIGKLKADVHSQIARNNPMQKQDTKALSLWIFQERNDLASLRTLAYQHSETNKALKDWIKEEIVEEKPENARDLEDIIGDKLVRLLDKQVEIEKQYAAKFQQYRHALKAIREREEKLSDVREKKRSLQSRIANLAKTNPKSPKLTEFQKELKSLEHDTHDTEMDLADFKRFALKEAFYLRFNAMNEYAEKTALISGFGKYLTDLIEIEPTPAGQLNRNPYEKGPDAAMILADAVNAINNWAPVAGDERPTLADATSNIPKSEPAETESSGKGKAKASPPELPPRPNEVPVSNESDVPSGYSAGEVASVTGDLKTAHESEIDLERIDLYDAPPPAYEAPEPSPLNSDQQNQRYQQQQQQQQQQQYAEKHEDEEHHQQQQQQQQQQQYQQHQQHQQQANEHAYSNASFQSPYQAHSPLPPHNQSPRPTHVSLTDSPASMHQQQYQQQQQQQYHPSYSPPHTQQSYHWAPPQQQNSYYDHRNSSVYDPTGMMFSPVNYQQLYRQVSQRQRPPAYRPYAEFQQQVNPQSRVDAGGFRIPAAPIPTAEEEKERLAAHYKRQESQSHQNNDTSSENEKNNSDSQPPQ